jgi:RHS repeat-associated protein
VQKYWYDANGNITTPSTAAKMRIQLYFYMNSGWVAYDEVTLKQVSAFDLAYDEENRLKEVRKNNSLLSTFVYDADGNRVMTILEGTPNDTFTVHLGNYYERETVGANTTVRKYYYASGTRVAMRVNGTLSYILGDHLGSTNLTTNNTGTKTSETLYKGWGEVRYSYGANPTNFTYTGQYSYTANFGLMFYGARWYDPSLNRWTQPDTDVPESQGVQRWDRFSYVSNNPLRYIDPTGHYGEEVHKDLTHDLAYNAFYSASYGYYNNQAQAAGMDPSAARYFTESMAQNTAEGIATQIANADQGVDTSYSLPNTTPAHVLLNGAKFMYEQVVEPPHKMTTESGTGVVNNAIETLDPSAVGVGLHMYQDSFSNREKARAAWLVVPGAGPILYELSDKVPALVALGHTVSGGRCDDFDPSSILDQQMVAGTEAFLKRYASNYFGK